jgi:hypothetical protein
LATASSSSRPEAGRGPESVALKLERVLAQMLLSQGCPGTHAMTGDMSHLRVLLDEAARQQGGIVSCVVKSLARAQSWGCYAINRISHIS